MWVFFLYKRYMSYPLSLCFFQNNIFMWQKFDVTLLFLIHIILTRLCHQESMALRG